MKISVAIITYNEEANIEKCLQSVRSIADEIVVVDSFSTDHTVDICRRYASSVYLREFAGYGQQKRFAVEKATHHYILALDADEVLSDILLNSINKIKNQEDNFAGYTFNRRNFYCGKPIRHCGWYPDVQLRFFDKKRINWNEKPVHEKVNRKNFVVRYLKGDLLHYTCTSIEAHAEKEERYALINGRELACKGKRILFFIPYIKFLFRFIKTYFFQFGFLDGYYGFTISKTLARSSFIKYHTALKCH